MIQKNTEGSITFGILHCLIFFSVSWDKRLNWLQTLDKGNGLSALSWLSPSKAALVRPKIMGQMFEF